MRVGSFRWPFPASEGTRDAQLVLVFGAHEMLEAERWFEAARRRYPSAYIVGCSTAGEVLGGDVGDLGIVGVAVRFEATPVRVSRINVREYLDSETAARYLARQMDPRGLRHVLLFCDGQHVNGSELVAGLGKHLPPGVGVTGGLAGDGTRFERTYVCANGPPVPGGVAAIALYGERLRVGYGSLGGWDPEGFPMRVTRARGNVLEQLDGEPALVRYKALLGADAAGLPASGLLHPLHVTGQDGRAAVRTLLNVNEECQSLTFAGDVPVGSRVQLMRANFDRLVAGASGAANSAALQGAELALLVSCVGRRLVLQERTREEVAAVRKVLGEDVPTVGFYSYGELCPSAPGAACDLHNQTMTITTLREAL